MCTVHIVYVHCIGVPDAKLTGLHSEVPVCCSSIGSQKYRCTYTPTVPGNAVLSPCIITGINQNSVTNFYLSLLDHLRLPHYKSPTALLDMHHLTCGISSLLHSVNLILFTLLLVHSSYVVYHLITVPSPHLHSRHLSLPQHNSRLKT